MELGNPGHPEPLELFFGGLAAVHMQRQDCGKALPREGFKPQLWLSEAGIFREGNPAASTGE